jgi:hypothetical protein
MENAFGNQDVKPHALESEVSKCSGCGSLIKTTDDFCGECGAKVNGAPISGAEKLWSDEISASVNKASKWVLAIAFMFIVFGTIMGLMQKGTTDTALANLVQYEDSATWSVPIHGKTVTVGELRSMVKFEYYSVFVLNYFLAIVMFVIFKWSKTAPFSAFVTALSIYIGVIVLSAVVDPKTIIQGIIVKALVIMALVNGIKAAIPTRGLARGSL